MPIPTSESPVFLLKLFHSLPACYYLTGSIRFETIPANRFCGPHAFFRKLNQVFEGKQALDEVFERLEQEGQTIIMEAKKRLDEAGANMFHRKAE